MTLIDVDHRRDAISLVLGKYPEPVLIPKERYTSREFLELENEKFWPHVWQFACRVEELEQVGDYVEYVIGDRSVLLVRSDPETIKGFHNACLHRGRALKEGCGSARELRCPFHAWRYNLDGTIKEVVDPETFHPDSIRPEDLCLPEVVVDTWGGFVFINFDHDCEPLNEFLADLPEYFDPMGIEDMRVQSVRTLAMDANWKVGLEAFVEAYHVIGTHHQVLAYTDIGIVDGDRSIVTGRHVSFPQPVYGQAGSDPTPDGEETDVVGVRPDSDILQSGPTQRYRMAPREILPSPYSLRLGPGLEVDERANLVRMITGVADERGLMIPLEDVDLAKEIAADDIPDGMTPFMYYNQRRIERLEASGVKMPKTMNAPLFTVFPNFTTPGPFRNLWLFRFRPHATDPDKCFFDIYVLTRCPEGEKSPVLREFHDPAATGDSEKDVAEYSLLLLQDIRNIPLVQRGLHSLAKPGIRASAVQELGVRLLHEGIDGYLSRDWS
jgi:phenylpropionate dioxygenase-like ring-hydroxylating dioxygenase large terminal subunit